MLAHIFKLIWKKKRSNFLLMLEIFVSFLILFAVSSFSVYNFRNYAAPAGMQADNVWAVFLNFNTDSLPLVRSNRELVERELRQIPGVEQAAFFSNNLPFSMSSMNQDVHYGNAAPMTESMRASTALPEVLGVQVTEGRWFTAADTVATKNRPAVITRHLKEELMGPEDAIGKTLNTGTEQGEPIVIVGVVDHFKHESDFQAPANCMFMPLSGQWDNNMLLKIRPGADAETEALVAQKLQKLGPDWNVEIQHLSTMKTRKNNMTWIPMMILYIVCGFLVFNVALGLFGVLFQNIQRRRHEIGLRRAIGASQGHILRHFMSETAMITTFGVALGLFFAVQFPLLRVFDVEAIVYLWGIILAASAIYLLVVLCAWLPSKQASEVQPATALHEE